MSNIEPCGTAEPFFYSLLSRAWAAEGLPENDHAEYYLAEVLAYFTPKQEMRIKVRLLLADLVNAVYHARSVNRVRLVKRIADSSLIAAGLLGPYLLNKETGIRFYIDTGQRAYGILVKTVPPEDLNLPVYRTFAESLTPFVGVLNDVRMRLVGWKMDIEDVVQVCNRYLKWHDEASRRWLIEHGIDLLPEFTEHLTKQIIIP